MSNPWRKPKVLAVLTWAYFAWWFVPILLAVRTAFNAGDAIANPYGFSLQWFWRAERDPELRRAFLQSMGLGALTVAAALPLGTTLALALHHLRTRSSRALGAVAILALATPQPALAVALFFLSVHVFRFVRLDSGAQILGHITLALPIVAIIVRVRLLAIGRDYEEMAMDLGASPAESLRRVLLPLLSPALIVAGVVAFAVSFDNIVISDFLCLPNNCRTIPTFLYNTGRGGDPAPTLYALATIGLVLSILVVASAAWLLRLNRARRLA